MPDGSSTARMETCMCTCDVSKYRKLASSPDRRSMVISAPKNETCSTSGHGGAPPENRQSPLYTSGGSLRLHGKEADLPLYCYDCSHTEARDATVPSPCFPCSRSRGV